jgi:hypothetical protein
MKQGHRLVAVSQRIKEHPLWSGLPPEIEVAYQLWLIARGEHVANYLK